MINGKSEYDEDDYDDVTVAGETEETPLPPLDRKEAAEAVSTILEIFEDEILKDVYGDHATITIYRDGRTSIEEYYHD